MTLKEFKLQPPVENFNWKMASQLFGVAKGRYYTDFKIPGHNGIDIVDKYGANILAAHNGTVIGISNDLSRSRGSGIIIQCILEDNTVVQTIYWHLSEILVTSGQNVVAGQVIGRMGNTGYVFPEPSDVCPHCGTHLHFGLSLFRNGKPLFTDYNNNADPVPYLFKEGDRFPINFPWDMFVGFMGDTVSWLQTILRLEGFAEDYLPVGFFGSKTRRDVILLQQKLGISPMFGYVGPKTRDYLNRKYSARYK